MIIGKRSATKQWRWGNHVLPLTLYIALPSLVWSFVYREPKIVADVLLLLVLESLVSSVVARALRLGWCMLCVSMLLLEWNIFPESYLFYLGLMARAVSFPQARMVLLGFGLLLVFIVLSPRPFFGRHALISFLAAYAALAGAKIWPLTKPHLVWLRQPALRAIQVAWTDSSRLLTASVAPERYNASSPGHAQLGRWLDQGGHGPPKIMVILLESWGERPDRFSALMKTIGRSAAASEIASGYTAFSGPTLSGEVRDLCGKVLSFRSVNASLSDCLPRRAQALGYQTTAFHGYDGYFYNRQILYPQIGFERSWFASDFPNAARCGGAFNGICDDIMLARAFEQLKKPGRQLVYFMSLSAHEPISLEIIERDYVRAAAGGGGPLDGKRLNEAVIGLAITKARQLARDQDVALYIAGDHNPPGREEALDLPEGKVPFILLRWRREQ